MGTFISRSTCLIQSRGHKLNNLMVMVSNTYGCQGHDDIGIFFFISYVHCWWHFITAPLELWKEGCNCPSLPHQILAGYKAYLFLQKALNLCLLAYIFRFSDLPTALHYSSFDRYIFVYVLVKFCDVAKKPCIIIVEKKEKSIFLHRAWFAYISSYVYI